MRNQFLLGLFAVSSLVTNVSTAMGASAPATLVTPTPATAVVATPIVAPTSTPTPTPKSTNASNASISFDLDDGYANQLEGLSIFNKMQVPYTLGIITQANTKKFDPLGTLYLNDAQIKLISLNPLASFASHSVTHADLAKSTPTQIRSELIDSRNYLQALIGRRVRYFIAPYCSTNTESLNQAREIYDWVSVCGGEVNTVTNFNPYQIDRKMVDSKTTTKEFMSWISDAKVNGKALVITYHNTTATPTVGMEQNVTPGAITQQLQIAKNSGLKIIPSEEAFKRLALLKK
jgi:peptidoglycan/xylan/chitin deacetylase (PgdA/CDA1 family)